LAGSHAAASMEIVFLSRVGSERAPVSSTAAMESSNEASFRPFTSRNVSAETGILTSKGDSLRPAPPGFGAPIDSSTGKSPLASGVRSAISIRSSVAFSALSARIRGACGP